MKTLILGTDFVYDSNNNLIPIEINTNTAIDTYTPEKSDDIFDLTQLKSFVTDNGFTKIIFIGGLRTFTAVLESYCDTFGIEFISHFVTNNTIIPEVEDSPTTLIIRTAYDANAIVDDTYCKSSINFLKLIKNSSFGSEFAYLDDTGRLINNITTILDNGNHPNFILKSDHPHYDTVNYPKLYKVTNQAELAKILKNVTESYFMMPYYYNSTKLHGNHICVIRSFNLLVPPNLDSIPIGSHTKLSTRCIDESSTFDSITYELTHYDRNKYLTGQHAFNRPKIRHTDRIEMADETYKYPVDVHTNDLLKTVIIPNPHNVDLSGDLTNYHITYDEFISGTIYSSNIVTGIWRIDKFVDIVKFTFDDGTTWEDTVNSSYLILRNNEVRFLYLHFLLDDDKLILIDTTAIEFAPILKSITNIEIIPEQLYSGYEIAVAQSHVFLTLNDKDQSFAVIEHNVPCEASIAPGCIGSCAKGVCAGKTSCSCG